jgi:serine/threonine protein phosphatase 1
MSIFRRFRSIGRNHQTYGIPFGKLVYAIGDIHGRADLLETLLRLIEKDRETTDLDVNLVFLGDYIDRGDDTRRVIDGLIDLHHDFHLETTFLMGNHEDAMLRFLAAPEENANWLTFGGLATLLSYGVEMPSLAGEKAGLRKIAEGLDKRIPKSHRAFFERLRYWTQIGDYYFCHAGVCASLRPHEQPLQTLLWGEDASDLSRPWHAGLRVVHGHYAQASVDLGANRVCIDTGAYFSGRLTALRLEATRLGILQT